MTKVVQTFHLDTPYCLNCESATLTEYEEGLVCHMCQPWVSGGCSISTGYAAKVGGEALWASPISSGIAAKVGMVDGAESHM